MRGLPDEAPVSATVDILLVVPMLVNGPPLRLGEELYGRGHGVRHALADPWAMELLSSRSQVPLPAEILATFEIPK